jgi:hypothetical protein
LFLKENTKTMATKIKEIIHSEESQKCFILAQFQLVLHTHKKRNLNFWNHYSFRKEHALQRNGKIMQIKIHFISRNK